MKLSIIIVSFNTKKLLKNCLLSIKNLNLKTQDYEVIVVDNASSNGSVPMVKKDFPQVLLLAQKENLGFSKAVNLGLKKTQGEYFLLLNPDTQVKTSTFKNLLEFARKHPEAGVIGARLLNPDETIQASVYHLPTILQALKEYWFGQKGAYEKYAPKGGKPVEVEAVTGAAMLVPKTLFKKMGGLDERFFMYFEDLDFCRRARKRGFKVFYLPEAEVTHHHGQSAARVGSQAYLYLTQSSKIYHGAIKYYLLYLIIRLGQAWQKIF